MRVGPGLGDSRGAGGVRGRGPSLDHPNLRQIAIQSRRHFAPGVQLWAATIPHQESTRSPLKTTIQHSQMDHKGEAGQREPSAWSGVTCRLCTARSCVQLTCAGDGWVVVTPDCFGQGGAAPGAQVGAHGLTLVPIRPYQTIPFVDVTAYSPSGPRSTEWPPYQHRAVQRRPCCHRPDMHPATGNYSAWMPRKLPTCRVQILPPRPPWASAAAVDLTMICAVEQLRFAFVGIFSTWLGRCLNSQTHEVWSEIVGLEYSCSRAVFRYIRRCTSVTHHPSLLLLLLSTAWR